MGQNQLDPSRPASMTTNPPVSRSRRIVGSVCTIAGGMILIWNGITTLRGIGHPNSVLGLGLALLFIGMAIRGVFNRKAG